LNIDTTLSWKDHITELSSRLNKACNALRAIKPFMSTDVMMSIYYSYVHSILAYGIIFWGNSCFRDNIFRIQKRTISIAMYTPFWLIVSSSSGAILVSGIIYLGFKKEQ
jgi:hypothetical protein